MLSINTNISSLVAQHSMKTATQLLNQAVERMTTGYKINHAKDNAANYSIATNLTTKINSYMVAEENCAMGLDLLATANGTLDQISDKLTRLRDLATQASNGTYGQQSLNAINAEANALVDEINRLYSTAEYNGKKLFAETTESDFIVDINRRDTSQMVALANVDETTYLAAGTYSISTPEELEKLSTMSNNGHLSNVCEFVLGADIDLSGYSNWTPIGNIYHFRSAFDGNGYKIKNLNCSSSTEEGGLFFCIRGGTIKNIAIENFNIVANKYAGALCGLLHDATIENCYSISGTCKSEYNAGGLFAYAANSNIKNCYSNAEVTSTGEWGDPGGVVSTIWGTSIENCYSTGTINGINACGGLVGFATNSKISRCYTNVEINSTKKAGLLCGYIGGSVTISDCYVTEGFLLSGGGFLAGFNDEPNVSLNISNSYVLGEIEGLDYIFLRHTRKDVKITIDNCRYSQYYTNSSIDLIYNDGGTSDININNTSSLNGNINLFTLEKSSYIKNASLTTQLQISINQSKESQLNVELGFGLYDIENLKNIGLNNSDYLSLLDNMLSTVSAKQTEFGAVENRLNSALDEISIQYENLVSSRSTIRDADIAEVSSEYIRQQILQQASATLMATANQSPSIALQLI